VCRFRWAKCSLDDIARLRNDKAIKQALTRLPKDLTETYERILANISEDDKELAFRIFQWLTCSLRPMKLQEVIEGIALELEDTMIDPEAFLNDPEDIIEICGSLVSLDLDRGTVSLGHFSVREFLTAPGRKTGAHPEYFIDPHKTNFELAKLCLTYLCLGHFSIGPCTTGQELKRRCDNYALYSYAASKWPGHAREHVDVEDEPFISLVEHFFVDFDMNGNFDSWRQAYTALGYTSSENLLSSFNDYLRLDQDAEASRLIYACRLGLFSTAKRLIAIGFGVNAIHLQETLGPKTRASGNALNAACQSGNLDVVELILSAGADINAIAGEHGSALLTAIIARHRWDGVPDCRVVEFLLQKGANVNMITPAKTWPLQTATNYHDFECATLCVQAGAEVGWRDGNGSTMFENAAIFGEQEIFEMLRQRGGGEFLHPEIAETMDLTPGIDGYGLFLASESNFFESAQKILEQDGENIFKDPSFNLLVNHTFKSCAWNGYHKFIEQMLVYSGGSFNAYTECVLLAASQGHAKTLQALLDFKPPSFDDQLLKNLVVIATGRGHQAVVKEIQKRGIPPLCTDEHGWTPTLAAAVSAPGKNVMDKTLGVLCGVGSGFEALSLKVKRPSSWRLRANFDDLVLPGLVVDGTSVYLPPGMSLCWYSILVAADLNR
jgi:ankyrin repeat protein